MAELYIISVYQIKRIIWNLPYPYCYSNARCFNYTNHATLSATTSRCFYVHGTTMQPNNTAKTTRCASLPLTSHQTYTQKDSETMHCEHTIAREQTPQPVLLLVETSTVWSVTSACLGLHRMSRTSHRTLTWSDTATPSKVSSSCNGNIQFTSVKRKQWTV